MLVLEQSRERMGERFGDIIVGGQVERQVDLQPLRTGGLGEALESEVREDIPQPQTDLATLEQACRRARVEVKDHGARAGDIFDQCEGGMKFNGGEVGDPDQGS